ncbi:unnamed protein product [Psylliodes chrysocephalus]|uniref:Uncharacterized protein n=1 Tax=Psylliodes chrysocephalus TaxID=3402493 RepID=A0A9P0CZ61_9CUCU|nr:unnamed protein product [Psylliodes chrysocephala]
MKTRLLPTAFPTVFPHLEGSSRSVQIASSSSREPAPDHSYRAAVMLKKFYENKKKLRKVAALEKTEIIKTGRGPAPNIKKDSNHDLIWGLLNVKTVYGLDNEFDSDNQIIAELEVDILVDRYQWDTNSSDVKLS